MEACLESESRIRGRDFGVDQRAIVTLIDIIGGGVASDDIGPCVETDVAARLYVTHEDLEKMQYYYLLRKRYIFGSSFQCSMESKEH